ncbi:MAG: c-type cytochrome domain-containing protein, partial [Roseibacillus sp.]
MILDTNIRMGKALIKLALFSLVIVGVSNARAAGGVDFFEKEIRPLLHKHCYKCHSTEAEKLKGGLLLDSRQGWETGGDSGPAIVPGDVEGSLLLRAVSYEDDDLQM